VPYRPICHAGTVIWHVLDCHVDISQQRNMRICEFGCLSSISVAHESEREVASLWRRLVLRMSIFFPFNINTHTYSLQVWMLGIPGTLNGATHTRRCLSNARHRYGQTRHRPSSAKGTVLQDQLIFSRLNTAGGVMMMGRSGGISSASFVVKKVRFFF